MSLADQTLRLAHAGRHRAIGKSDLGGSGCLTGKEHSTPNRLCELVEICWLRTLRHGRVRATGVRIGAPACADGCERLGRMRPDHLLQQSAYADDRRVFRSAG